MQLGSQQETIRAVNRTIRDFADDPRIPPNEPWEFVCECGCFTLVTLTVAEFDTASHVWVEGHEASLLSA
jgi:hypothetical protein